MISIIHSIDLKWPFYVSDCLTITNKVSISNTEIASMQCILDNFEITEHLLHMKALIALLIPFFLIIIIIFILVFLKIMTKKTQWHRFIVSFIVMSVYLQPFILQNLFDNINKTTLNHKNYLTKELTFDYDDEGHQKWV